ncbi:MAG TPA: ribosome biogenesis GTP-binding protein YihA/YsxC [Bacillota bacterium]|nr:YihA family ribosome biogenesis GTP-binding protein [Clostridiales bacterium]HPT84978.1 ribosome biogenesis GTP-binding protein YihA/YsxC [Bacillota bacterium]
MRLNLNNVKLHVSAGQPDQFPTDGRPQIIFSGRSNVGKSSLINTLLGRRGLARVSSVPGKTITINFYDIDGKLWFVDLPGYGFAKRPREEKKRWSALTDAFLRAPYPGRRFFIQLIDAKAGASADDHAMADWMNAVGVPFVYAATKIDKLNKTAREARLAEMRSAGATVIPFSAVTGEGRAELWAEIYKFLG